MTADARFGQAWSTRQRLKNAALYRTLCGLDRSVRCMPAAWRARTLQVLAEQVLARSRIAEDNVARVFPAWSPLERAAFLRRHARRLAKHAADALAVSWAERPSAPLPFAGDSESVLRAAIAEGCGVVLASAHLGAWERVARTLVDAGIPFTAVVREPYDPRLQRFLSALRRGVPTIARGAPQATRAMLRCLRSGGVLGIPMDLATRGASSCMVPFLGHPTALVTGPARLALRSNAAVVVATYTERYGEEGLSVTRIDPIPRHTEALTAALAAALSSAILRCPEEWLWLHPRWATPA